MIYLTYKYWIDGTRYCDGHYSEATKIFFSESALRDFVEGTDYIIIGIWDLRR